MNVQYMPGIQSWAEGFKLIQQATRRLEEILGSSAGLVTVHWESMTDAKGRPRYRLTLRGFTAEVSTVFTPDELRNPLSMEVGLYRLWGDMIQVRSDQQHERVKALIGQFSGEQEGR